MNMSNDPKKEYVPSPKKRSPKKKDVNAPIKRKIRDNPALKKKIRKIKKRLI